MINLILLGVISVILVLTGIGIWWLTDGWTWSGDD